MFTYLTHSLTMNITNIVAWSFMAEEFFAIPCCCSCGLMLFNEAVRAVFFVQKAATNEGIKDLLPVLYF